MMKLDKNFRLPKEVKRLMASMPKEKSSSFKKLMIQSIIIGSINPPKEKKNKNNTTKEE